MIRYMLLAVACATGMTCLKRIALRLLRSMHGEITLFLLEYILELTEKRDSIVGAQI